MWPYSGASILAVEMEFTDVWHAYWPFRWPTYLQMPANPTDSTLLFLYANHYSEISSGIAEDFFFEEINPSRERGAIKMNSQVWFFRRIGLVLRCASISTRNKLRRFRAKASHEIGAKTGDCWPVICCGNQNLAEQQKKQPDNTAKVDIGERRFRRWCSSKQVTRIFWAVLLRNADYGGKLRYDHLSSYLATDIELSVLLYLDFQ